MFTPFPRMPAGPYPPIDPALFSQSATTAQTLMNDAATVLKKLAESRSFAASVMSAAQEGKTDEVKRLIRSLGIRSKTDIYFNPDGIRLTLSPPPARFRAASSSSACVGTCFRLFTDSLRHRGGGRKGKNGGKQPSLFAFAALTAANIRSQRPRPMR
ncbi:hypothetical protein [Geobacillus thermoleovorans]|uniref:hypothetical protein n=1 Tax=Geobacillus thermoleovorans TaxID=33941 RepID=UPI002989B61C|nr:hypothetical protein [Geobacillus thermoleovorans]